MIAIPYPEEESDDDVHPEPEAGETVLLVVNGEVITGDHSRVRQMCATVLTPQPDAYSEHRDAR
jgi:hypothetical protein